MQFKDVTAKLVERYEQVLYGCEHITLVYDEGNNSAVNLAAVEESPYHFVGSLVPSQHKDCWRSPARSSRPLRESGKRHIELSHAVDGEALQKLKDHSLGKTVLFTDNHSWATEEIVAAYRGQSAVEDAFKRMKDPHFLSWSPMFHWTDQKIRAHAFYCVLALTLCSLLRRELHLRGIDLSIPAVLETLSNIHEVALVYPGRGRRKDPLVLSERSPLQQKILEVLKLEELAPTT